MRKTSIGVTPEGYLCIFLCAFPATRLYKAKADFKMDKIVFEKTTYEAGTLA